MEIKLSVSPIMFGVCVALAFLLQLSRVSAMECGTVNIVRPQILGGNKVLKGEWPFTASIRNQSKYICGGTIISNRHILTAAHCIHKKYSWRKLLPKDVKVRMGAYNLSDINESGVFEGNVSEIFIHPDWKPFRRSFDADIAIMTLSENITFTYDIQPVCMPGDGSFENIKGTIVGWGMQENSSNAEIPRKATISAAKESDCLREDTGLSAFTSERTFCGGNGDGTSNRGDSGGGFFIISGSVWVQYGIVSGIRTNDTGHVIPNGLTLYTNLTAFKDWMIETVSQTGGVVVEAMISVTMTCDYGYDTESTEPYYGCRLYDIDIQKSNIRAASIAGTHLPEKTKQDVESIHFVNGTMFYLPNGIGSFFENIKNLSIGATGFRTRLIRRSDFQNFENLVELRVWANDIEILNADALWELLNLEEFHFVQNKLEILFDETFNRNEKLKYVYLNSNRLKHLPASLFRHNLLLEIVDFRNNFLTTIDERLFQTNVLLARVSFISNQLESLPANLFRKNLLLELVDFQKNSIATIDEKIFETNAMLFGASFFSNKLEALPKNLFKHNLRLQAADFYGNSLSSIDENLFESNSMLLGVSFIANKLEVLPKNLLKHNLLLKIADFKNNSLSSIDEDLFETNANLKKITLASNQLTSLPSNLFRNNTLLDTVDLQNNLLTKIDGNIFEKNVFLSRVYLASNRLEIVEQNLFKNNLLLERIDLSNNTLKVIEVDFVGLKDVKLVNLDGNNCTNAMYLKFNGRTNGKYFGSLQEFQTAVTANCSTS